MSWPAPTRADHDRFCRVEGWRPVRDARGRSGTHQHPGHRCASGPGPRITFELALPDGRVLRTRISHPPDRTGYGPSVWRHILRDQLDVTEAEFWACVRDGRKPPRGATALSAASLPADVVHLLLTRVGLAEPEIVGMSREEAFDRLHRFWSRGA